MVMNFKKSQLFILISFYAGGNAVFFEQLYSEMVAKHVDVHGWWY
jgi:hypothetical protein